MSFVNARHEIAAPGTKAKPPLTSTNLSISSLITMENSSGDSESSDFCGVEWVPVCRQSAHALSLS
ncbi:hypothetical protein M514_01050 [Trichuris suis]|uniref:Uncharacterized protein n=1 Tax=Trichuris suis TaxID=68888 RepID=A0A085NM56_9BILA|nr:hypothetical protein M513_01050 [Trichuris suis]KFD70552.1 hypothetical protein M514_01050 [Trichuris suis]